MIPGAIYFIIFLAFLGLGWYIIVRWVVDYIAHQDR